MVLNSLMWGLTGKLPFSPRRIVVYCGNPECFSLFAYYHDQRPTTCNKCGKEIDWEWWWYSLLVINRKCKGKEKSICYRDNYLGCYFNNIWIRLRDANLWVAYLILVNECVNFILQFPYSLLYLLFNVNLYLFMN